MVPKEQVRSRGSIHPLCSLDDWNWSWLPSLLLQTEGKDTAGNESGQFEPHQI